MSADYETNPFPLEGRSFAILRSEVPYACPLHAHSFIEIAYIEAGAGSHEVDGRTYPIRRGDLYLINPRIPHSFLSTGGPDQMLTVVNCIFHAGFIHDALSDCENFLDAFYQFFFNSIVRADGVEPGFIKLSDAPAFGFSSILRQMSMEYENQLPGWQTVIKSCLTNLIVQIFRSHQQLYDGQGALSECSRQIVENTIQYIREQYGRPLHLGELASRVYLSPAYFSRLFKQHTNMTLTQFIQAERVAAARRLLTSTDMQVERIAEETGYRDMKTFYDAFKKITGLTPGQYRRRAQGQDFL